MKHSRLIALFILLLILSSAGTALVYGLLPQQIALQWNADGDLISSGPRFTLIFTSLFPLFTLWLLFRTPAVSSGNDRPGKHQSFYSLAVAFFLCAILGIHWLIILHNLGVFLGKTSLVMIIIGIGLLFIGRQLKRLPFGSCIGIRTPWNMSSPYNWECTHRFAANLFFVGGAVSIAVSPFSGRSSFWIGAGGILALAVLSYYYSYSIAKREGNL